jgi:hypothetical protein
MNITKSDAIKSLHPNVPFSFINGQINLWESDQPQPTEEQIQAKIAELTAAEPMRQLRQQRDQLLSATDWWVLPDRTPTQAQLAYRQALRDLPATASPALDEDGNLTGVTWPTKPE